jgi:hypothetical protein
MRRLGPVLAALTLVVAVAACSDDEGDGAADGQGSSGSSDASTSTTGAAAAEPGSVLWSPEGNNLWAYSTAPGESMPPSFASQLVNTNNHDDPEGWDINGQVCTLDDGRILTGEDTHQPDPPAGWGIFEVGGDAVGALSIERVARLVPPFPDGDSEPDTYGCGVLPDGRVVTTTIGNTATGPGNGQLVLWFPPFDSPDGAGIESCVIADGIATAQQIWIDGEGGVFVASARPPTSGVWRYGPDLPASADECAPVDGDHVVVGDDENLLVSPNGVVGDDEAGVLYVSSIINGVIAEVGVDGSFRRIVLAPPDGESLLDGPYSTGTPLGLARGDDGTLYYADLGLVSPGEGELPSPEAGAGSVRRITFVEGEPQPPDVIADGLTFPDSLGLWPVG